MAWQDFLRNNSQAMTQAGLGFISGRNAQEQAAMGAQGLAQAQQVNKTMRFFEQSAPEIAAQIRAGKPIDQAWSEYAQLNASKLEAQKPKSYKDNLMTVGKSIYNAQTGEWITPPAGMGGADDAEYGLNPQYGTDANGNPVILQLSKGGTSKQTMLPEGIQLSKEPIKLDAGTHFVLLDPITRQPVGQIQKDLAGAERDKELGTAEGKAIAAAPGDIQSGQNALDIVESLRNDPAKAWGVGGTSVFNAIPGTPGKGFQNKVDQAKSGAFLTAIQQMRGLGALSNAEGGAATAAVTRMDTATNEADFNAALDDYEKIIRQGINRAQARVPAQAGGATDYKTRYGLD